MSVEDIMVDIVGEIFEKYESPSKSVPVDSFSTHVNSRFPKPLQLALNSPSVSPAFHKMLYFPKDTSPKKRKRNFDELRYPRAYTSIDMIDHLKLQEQRKLELTQKKMKRRKLKKLNRSRGMQH